MKFQIDFVTAFVIAILTTIAVAAPADVAISVENGEVGALDLVTARLCNGHSLTGYCRDITINSQTTCFNLRDIPELYQRVISIGVPAGRRCRLWKATNCVGGSTSDIHSPGINQLHDVRFGNIAGSFKCYV